MSSNPAPPPPKKSTVESGYMNPSHVGTPILGNQRFQAERRQYGGLLIVLGLCALIQPLANISTGVDPTGPVNADPTQVAYWQFVGACCLFVLGVTAMLVGYVEAVQDWGDISLHTLSIVITQLAFIPYLSDMVMVGMVAASGAPQFFMPFPDDPRGLTNQAQLDNDEVAFMGAMGIAGIITYGFAFIGSIAFMQFSLLAFRKRKPQSRNAGYFQGRLGFYSVILFIAGLAQLLLGSFATELSITGGRIDGGLIRVAMFVVHMPYLNILVGIVQFLNGFWGFTRAFYVFVGGRDDNFFQYSMAFQWILVLICQIIVQLAYLPVGMLAPAAPTLAAMTFGINFMPAYLDYKMRTTPEIIHDSYYFDKKTDAMPLNEKSKPLEIRKVYVTEQQPVVDEDYFDEEAAWNAYLNQNAPAPALPKRNVPPPQPQQRQSTGRPTAPEEPSSNSQATSGRPASNTSSKVAPMPPQTTSPEDPPEANPDARSPRSDASV